MTQTRPLLLPTLCLVLYVLVGTGCTSWSPNAPEIIDVKAKYLDLENKSVAVVVSTRDHTTFNFPDAAPRITKEISRRIAAGVPGVTMTVPEQIVAWQEANPYWATRPPSRLIQELEVDRLVLVEIGMYQLHEPGNKHQLRGVISASVHVVEAEAEDPDNYGASFDKAVMYPDPNVSLIGRVGESESQVELKAQLRFCEEAAGLFFDHKIAR